MRKEVLNSGETAVAIAVGDNCSDTFKIDIQWDTDISEDENNCVSNEMIKIGVVLSDMNWEMTIVHEADSFLRITSEYTAAYKDSPIHQLHIHPKDEIDRWRLVYPVRLGQIVGYH